MNGSGAYLEPHWADQRFLKEFSEISQPQNFKDPQSLPPCEENVFLGEVCACTRRGRAGSERGHSSPE